MSHYSPIYALIKTLKTAGSARGRYSALVYHSSVQILYNRDAFKYFSNEAQVSVLYSHKHGCGIHIRIPGEVGPHSNSQEIYTAEPPLPYSIDMYNDSKS